LEAAVRNRDQSARPADVKADCAIGIDIGGTKIAGGLVAREGLIGEVRTAPTEAAEGGPAVLRRAIELARNVMADFPNLKPTAVGIATGGWIERSTGRVVSATDLLPGWSGTDLRSEFERATGLRAFAINDVHAMGLAEARLGAGRDCQVCLSVAVGTGIGGAITVGGELLEGAHGMAGAVGHITYQAGGARCSCGRRGCIEAYASGPAIARSFARCLGQDLKSTGLPDLVKGLNSQHQRMQRCAVRTTDSAGAALGHVLAGVANTIDPDLIVLGGGAAFALGEPFLAAVRSAVARRILPPISAEVVPAQLGPVAGVIGAGLIAIG
jgi:glucokinase